MIYWLLWGANAVFSLDFVLIEKFFDYKSFFGLIPVFKYFQSIGNCFTFEVQDVFIHFYTFETVWNIDGLSSNKFSSDLILVAVECQ